jgi:hypothetical protein
MQQEMWRASRAAHRAREAQLANADAKRNSRRDRCDRARRNGGSGRSPGRRSGRTAGARALLGRRLRIGAATGPRTDRKPRAPALGVVRGSGPGGGSRSARGGVSRDGPVDRRAPVVFQPRPFRCVPHRAFGGRPGACRVRGARGEGALVRAAQRAQPLQPARRATVGTHVALRAGARSVCEGCGPGSREPRGVASACPHADPHGRPRRGRAGFWGCPRRRHSRHAARASRPAARRAGRAAAVARRADRRGRQPHPSRRAARAVAAPAAAADTRRVRAGARHHARSRGGSPAVAGARGARVEDGVRPRPGRRQGDTPGARSKGTRRKGPIRRP